MRRIVLDLIDKEGVCRIPESLYIEDSTGLKYTIEKLGANAFDNLKELSRCQGTGDWHHYIIT